MWKDYFKGCMKNNRASCFSVMAAAFIAAMFLSLLCSTAYNFWVYEIAKITLEEGGWQGRVTGEIGNDGLDLIRGFKNVERAEINGELSERLPDEKTVVDICFKNMRTIYRDMPLIAEMIGLKEEDISYHEFLLSRYFIHDPEDEDPPLLLTAYAGILIITAAALVLIIRNSFELSMDARIHQFGIFSTVGATPGQIRSCLLQEAAYLSGIPAVLGSLTGIGISFCIIKAVNYFASDVSGRRDAVFQYHPFILAITLLISAATILFSAWIPAQKMSRMTPIEAVRNTGSLDLKRGREFSVSGLLLGIEGELAENALKAQKKSLRISLRISSLSLIVSFLGFSLMICFTTLSDISTRYTYFERYQDVWDVMINIKDTAITDFEMTEEVQRIPDAGNVTVYQKAEAAASIPKNWQSDELAELGGLETVAEITEKEGKCQVKVPIVILDDDSFRAYCVQTEAAPNLNGAIVINRIWNSADSNFRYKKYVPFVKEDRDVSVLYSESERSGEVKVPILAYVQDLPVLREEYEDYALVHIMPVSLWKKLAGSIQNVESDSYIRILCRGNADLKKLNDLEREAVRMIGQRYEIESENRIQERISNNRMITGMKMILGGFCALLAVIGIANVFLNTLSFLRHRKREFAQYMSVGLTPKMMRKMFWIEAFAMVGKPLLITLPLTWMFVKFALAASYLEPEVFWSEAPILPMAAFAAAVSGFVVLAYWIGGRRLLRCDLSEVLKNDALI